MTHARPARASILSVLCAVLAGCSATAGEAPVESPVAEASVSPAPSGSGTPPASTAPVAETLRFTSTTVDGKRFDAAALAGKPAVLWFWAAWCSRCRAAAPHVAAVQADYSQKVNMVGVAGLGSGKDNMADFVDDTGIDHFPHLADDAGAVWQRFGVTSQEYFVLLDKAGKVVHQGPLTRDDLRSRVSDLAG
jgi:thiol-disulfide isomerase/thioredoxin